MTKKIAQYYSQLLWLVLSVAISPAASLAQSQGDPDVLEFLYITDTHRYGSSADIRYAEANINAFLDYRKKTPNLSFAVFGGDFMNAYDTDHRQALWCLDQSQNDFADLGLPFYVTKGNHDCNGKQRTARHQPDNSQIITDHEFYGFFSPLSPTNPNYAPEGIVVNSLDPEGNYYYRDFETQQCRLIMLNSYDRDSLEFFGFHGKQLKWLAETALNFTDKENPEDWCFLLVAHAFPTGRWADDFSRLIFSYVHGEDFMVMSWGLRIRANYSTMRRARLVALLGGHFHEDMYRNEEGYNLITTTRGFATGGEVEADPVCFDHFVLNRRTRTLEAHRIGRGRSRTFSYEIPTLTAPTLAFPSADGQGAYTSGGRGGRVIKVTNLHDSGPGSLRWAVEQQGCRTILFSVSGYIDLKSPLVIANDSVTIAGQTAPGSGIFLRGAPLQITASEVIVRYLRVRPGRHAGQCDAISDGDFGQHNVILDHISCGWTEGSAVAFRHVQNATVQRCLLTHSFVTEGSDAAPGLLAGGFMTTYYNNIIASHNNAIMVPNEEGCNRWIHLTRNVISNWGDHAIWGGGCQGEVTIEENYFIPYKATQHLCMLDVADDGTGRYYISGNEMAGYEEHTAYNAGLVNDRPGVPYQPKHYDAALRARMAPVARPQHGSFSKSCLTLAAFHTKPVLSNSTPVETYWQLITTAGCSLHRDGYDRHGIEYLAQRKSGAPGNGLVDDEKTVGGFPSLSHGKVLVDSDNDGMPDEWELLHELDPNDPSDGNVISLNADRTNLEVYLNELVGE